MASPSQVAVSGLLVMIEVRAFALHFCGQSEVLGFFKPARILFKARGAVNHLSGIDFSL